MNFKYSLVMTCLNNGRTRTIDTNLNLVDASRLQLKCNAALNPQFTFEVITHTI